MILLGFCPLPSRFMRVVFMSKNIQKITQDNTSLPKNELTFELAVTELESIVSQMESGQLPLEQSLAAYKRGAELLQFCQKALSDIEQQVHILNEANQLQTYSAADE